MAEQRLAQLLDEAGLADSDLPVVRLILGTTDASTVADRLEAVRKVAFREFLEWAMARRRFNSVSELDTARVLALYVRVRREPATVESLVEQLAIPQGRATSMLARIKYGDGRALMAMSFEAAAKDVEARLKEVDETNRRKSITVSSDVVDRIQEVAFEIVSAPVADHNKGGRFELAEEVTSLPSGRWGATVTTSTKTWGYIVSLLRVRGQSA
jgi:hypothetical protein